MDCGLYIREFCVFKKWFAGWYINHINYIYLKSHIILSEKLCTRILAPSTDQQSQNRGRKSFLKYEFCSLCCFINGIYEYEMFDNMSCVLIAMSGCLSLAFRCCKLCIHISSYPTESRFTLDKLLQDCSSLTYNLNTIHSRAKFITFGFYSFSIFNW